MTNLVKDFAIRASFAKFVIHKIEFNRKKYLAMKKLLILFFFVLLYV